MRKAFQLCDNCNHWPSCPTAVAIDGSICGKEIEIRNCKEFEPYIRFGGRTVKQVLKLCRECRTNLKEHGYNLREDEILPESIEDCELCGRRTGVKYCEIQKGERPE